METIHYYLTDVFAEKKYAGNPLAVFTDAGHLSEEEMQTIAKEINYSETTFILSREERDGGYDVRIFTPETELPFAGHPTLGTAYIIREKIIGEPVDQVVLNLKAGRIPVAFGSDGDGPPLVMDQLPPLFGETYDRAELAQVLGISADDIDPRFPVQDVSTGIHALIVPLRSMGAVQRCRVKQEPYDAFIRKAGEVSLLVFAPEACEPANDLHVRVFVDCHGVPEDPATGSANGCLAGYLVKHRVFGSERIALRAEQGYEIRRPSLLYLQATDEEGAIRIRVGGNVVPVAQGEWLVDTKVYQSSRKKNYVSDVPYD
jgi:trans-2,3-dihydro-3-hydroxyanthranilate isomerase